jgi:6-methylsalicylate decarboxylase
MTATDSAINRRQLISAAAALGGSAVLSERSSAKEATGAAPTTGTIDVHSHMIPPFLLQELLNSPDVPAGLKLPAARDWTAARTIESLDRHGVATAVLSAVPLHAALNRMNKDAVAQLARRMNEFAATLRQDHRGRFGLFSFLPMPDVERSLAEIEYSLDTLKANGVGLFTTYGDQSIADPAFLPVLEELHRRKAIVFCHPDLPDCCGKPTSVVGNVVAASTGFPYDTGRAVFGLLLSGTLSRYPDIRWIFCHGGGPVPVLAGRVREMARSLESLQQAVPRGVDHELRRLYYETANATNAPAMSALLNYVPFSQVLFGSDAPYFGVDVNLSGLRESGLTDVQLQAIQRDNALRLITELR